MSTREEYVVECGSMRFVVKSLDVGGPVPFFSGGVTIEYAGKEISMPVSIFEAGDYSRAFDALQKTLLSRGVKP